MALRLGEILVRRGVLTNAQRNELLERQRVGGRPIGELAERIFGVSPSVIEQAWAAQYAQLADKIDPARTAISDQVLALVDRRQAWQFKVLPVRFIEGDLLICTAECHLARVLRFCGWRLTHSCSFAIAPEHRLEQALSRFYPFEGVDQHEELTRKLVAMAS
ncbi:MAG: hypothetical protein ACF8SC_02945 [Phycisphaerales bacterium JB037]